MTRLLPFVVVSLAAVGLVLLELLKTFRRDLLPALRDRWSWALIAVNLMAASLVYGVVRILLSPGDSLVTAVFVGLSFPLLLRSRFTYFRAVGAKEDERLNAISIKIDEAYGALQNLCWESVDAALADRRAAQAEQLAERLSPEALVKSIEQQLAALRIEANRARDQKRLDAILPLPDEHMRKYRLALLLIDINPIGARRLLRRGG